jgi:hypothetical protein
MKRAVATTLYARERGLFFFALTCLSIAFSAYVYYLSAAVVHVVVREEIDADIARTTQLINDLEARYIEARRHITFEKAADRGFHTTSENVYLARTPTNLVLHREGSVE